MIQIPTVIICQKHRFHSFFYTIYLLGILILIHIYHFEIFYNGDLVEIENFVVKYHLYVIYILSFYNEDSIDFFFILTRQKELKIKCLEKEI